MMSHAKQPPQTPSRSDGQSLPKTQQPEPQKVGEQGGMIGEGTSGEAAADVTEDDPRTTRPGGMIGEG